MHNKFLGKRIYLFLYTFLTSYLLFNKNICLLQVDITINGKGQVDFDLVREDLSILNKIK